MDSSPVAGDVREYTNADPALNYFEFTSAANSNSGNSEFRFLGTAVYYKIYSSASTMISNHSSIESVNTSSDYSAAAERMIKSYGYKELYTEKGSVSPLVSADMEGYYVRIRLTNYRESSGTEESWWSNKARIEIKPSKNSAVVREKYVPRRSLGSTSSFDFGRLNKPGYDNSLRYDVPKSGDEDFYGSTSSDGKYYIDMYAVAVGRDTTFVTYYSNVTYLGSMTIDANSEDN